MLFVNADRDYGEGRAQNHLRARDEQKITATYRGFADVDGFAKVVTIDEPAENDFNCNIRRYADNAPPPEPQDVRAHLQSGVPMAVIDAWLTTAEASADDKNAPDLAEQIAIKLHREARVSVCPAPRPRGAAWSGFRCQNAVTSKPLHFSGAIAGLAASGELRLAVLDEAAAEEPHRQARSRWAELWAQPALAPMRQHQTRRLPRRSKPRRTCSARRAAPGRRRGTAAPGGWRPICPRTPVQACRVDYCAESSGWAMGGPGAGAEVSRRVGRSRSGSGKPIPR